MSGAKPVLIVVGGGFAGMCACRNMHKDFRVILIDAKEYFEYTPSIPRAYVEPKCHSELSFMYQSVCDQMHVDFKWGELKSIDSANKTIVVSGTAIPGEETLRYDYLLVTVGCEYTMCATHALSPSSCKESLWYPTVVEETLSNRTWGHLDERFIGGRRAHLEDEAKRLKDLAEKKGTIVVVGAGPVGVEFATEAKHAYPDLKVVICDKRSTCLGGLPPRAIRYIQRWMDNNGITSLYNFDYNKVLGKGDTRDSNDTTFEERGIHPDRVYLCVGTLQMNKFADQTCLMPCKGPGRGGHIKVNRYMQVVSDKGASDSVFAAGTCVQIQDFEPLAGKVAPAEEMATIACKNIKAIAAQKAAKANGGGGCFSCFTKKSLTEIAYSGKAAMAMGFDLTSAGPHAATLVACNRASKPGSGCLLGTGLLASFVKETMIGWTKIDQCKGGLRGRIFWGFIGH